MIYLQIKRNRDYKFNTVIILKRFVLPIIKLNNFRHIRRIFVFAVIQEISFHNAGGNGQNSGETLMNHYHVIKPSINPAVLILELRELNDSSGASLACLQVTIC